MENRKTTVLVLGVGGNVSQGILKAIAASPLQIRVIGACVTPLAAGLYTVERSYLSPLAANAGFVPWLIETCRAENVQTILSGVEPVLEILAANQKRIQEECGAIPVVSSPQMLTMANNKLKTCQWLAANGLNYPRYSASGKADEIKKLVEDCGFPLIAKPCIGKGSHGVAIIRNETELASFRTQANYVIQEYLGDPTSEFTAGTFTDKEGTLRGTIVMRRDLLEGTTFRAELGDFPEMRAEAERIALVLKPIGPCNMQLRMTPRGPVCFEINLRFSGTTPIRARFGFNDVEMAIRHFGLGEPAVDLPKITSGIATRYWNELYIDPAAPADLKRDGFLDNPQKYLTAYEDFGVKR